ncbi:MAG: S8 family peptidase [Lachnospiraceae bacterium]|nr:S8 family peptidase [Lachnospiraceae bacterium]
MNKILQRTVSLVLVMPILCYSFMVCDVKIAGAKTVLESTYRNSFVFSQEDSIQKNEKTENYIVFSENGREYNHVTSEYQEADTISKNSEDLLEGNHVAVLTMSGKEANSLQNSEGIKHVEKDGMVKGSGKIRNRKIRKKKQSELKNEWNMEMVNTAGRKDGEGNDTVKVAIIDSGVDFYNDVEIQDYIDLVPGYEDVLPLYSDISGHGTSVAGVIAAQENEIGITGINPNVELYSARVLDENNEAPISRVIEGIYWAKSRGVNIINMSFGTAEDSEALHSAIKEAADAGILLVAAAGNTKSQVEYPAAYDEVIAVGSVDSDGIVSDNSANGTELELVAPGEKVASTGGFQGTVICSGTSMAAPHVSGIASLLWQKDKSVSAKFIRDLLRASANRYGDAREYGSGLVDYEYAESIYDEFKENYKEAEAVIEPNISQINTIESNEYVEGSWLGVHHQQLLDSVTVLSAADVKTMKEGAIYPDHPEDLKGKTANPGFHGAENYVANTIYLSYMARDGKLANASNYFTETEMENFGDIFNDMYTKLQKHSGDIKGKYFLWGIVIHNITDSYAHMTYVKSDSMSSWLRLVHDQSENSGNPGYLVGADNLYIARGRWDSAQTAVNNAIYEISRGRALTFRVYEHESYFNTYPNETLEGYPYFNYNFKMINLYQNAKAVDYGASYSTILKQATYGSFK